MNTMGEYGRKEWAIMLEKKIADENLHLLINGIFGIDDLRIWLHIICRQINSRNSMQWYPASEGYLQKIPLRRLGK
jgi:hypothetical protein